MQKHNDGDDFEKEVDVALVFIYIFTPDQLSWSSRF